MVKPRFSICFAMAPPAGSACSSLRHETVHERRPSRGRYSRPSLAPSFAIHCSTRERIEERHGRRVRRLVLADLLVVDDEIEVDAAPGERLRALDQARGGDAEG